MRGECAVNIIFVGKELQVITWDCSGLHSEMANCASLCAFLSLSLSCPNRCALLCWLTSTLGYLGLWEIKHLSSSLSRVRWWDAMWFFFSCLGLWPCRGNWNSRSPWKSGVSMVKTPQCHSVYDSTYLELRLCSESWGGGTMKSTNHLDARNLVSNVWGHSTSLISKSLTMHAMQLSYSGGHLLKVKINSLFFFSHKLICFHVFLY